MVQLAVAESRRTQQVEAGDPFVRPVAVLGFGAVALGGLGLYATSVPGEHALLGRYFAVGVVVLAAGVTTVLFISTSVEGVLQSQNNRAQMQVRGCQKQKHHCT
jgi:hypothetical protein